MGEVLCWRRWRMAPADLCSECLVWDLCSLSSRHRASRRRHRILDWPLVPLLSASWSSMRRGAPPQAPATLSPILSLLGFRVTGPKAAHTQVESDVHQQRWKMMVKSVHGPLTRARDTQAVGHQEMHPLLCRPCPRWEQWESFEEALEVKFPWTGNWEMPLFFKCRAI